MPTMISSSLMVGAYRRLLPDYERQRGRWEGAPHLSEGTTQGWEAEPNALILDRMDGWRTLYTDHLRIEDGHMILLGRPGIGLNRSPQALTRFKT